MSVSIPAKPNVELTTDLSGLVTGDTVLPPCPAAEANSAPAAYRDPPIGHVLLT